MSTIANHAALIDALGGNKAVSNGINGCKPVTVGAWKRAGRIPPEAWPEILRMARAKGLHDITSDWLMAMWEPRPVFGKSAEPKEAQA